MLSFLSRMTGNPGPLALFAINLRPRKGGAIKGAAPPSSYVEVLEGAVVSALHWHFCERAGGAGLVTDVENAREMFICLSTSMCEHAPRIRFHGLPRPCTAFHGPSTDHPRTVAFHGLPWPSMAFHGLPWPSTGRRSADAPLTLRGFP